MKIKLMIADDHELVRSAIKQFLQSYPDLQLVAEACCGSEVLDKLRTIQADVLLLDLVMPGISDSELISRVKRDYPSLRILVLSMHSDFKVVLRSMKAGASGYISKNSTPQMLIEAIRKVNSLGKYLEPAMAEKLAFTSVDNPELVLSKRERTILPMIIEGIPLKVIATKLSISDKTVSTHKSHIFSKLGLRNVSELVRYSMQNDLKL